jgi:zinc/manganese transport system substrate-binding protein
MITSIIFNTAGRAATAAGAAGGEGKGRCAAGAAGGEGMTMGTARARRGTWAAAVAGLAALALGAGACTASATGDATAGPGGSRMIDVVAAENFWGSLVGQLGGSHVRVLSIVSDPNADPHDYESSAQDARAVAVARYVVQNGVGYDDWMAKLLAANPSSGRRAYDIGATLGKHPGDNPHLWYNPAYVTAACDHIEADLKALDPADAGYFTARRSAVTAAFAPIRAELARMHREDAGRPVASTESIFAYLAGYLGLKLISPPAFMNAVAEGNDPPVASVVEFEHQLAARQARVLVYNKQTATALTTSVRRIAASQHLPVVGVTETIQPAGLSFEQWFGAELAALGRALNGGSR